MTADAAVRAVESDMRVYVHANAAFPQVLLEALARRSGQLRNVEVMHLLGFGEACYNGPEFAESFRHNALFIGANMRQAVQEGRADYIPVHLSEVERPVSQQGGGTGCRAAARLDSGPPWVLQPGRGGGDDADGGALRPHPDCAGQRPDAAHFWQHVHAHQRVRRHCGVLACAAGDDPGAGHRGAAG